MGVTSTEIDVLYRPLSWLGLMLIVLGVIFVALPMIMRYLPSLEKVPPLILWVYKSDGFYFAISPILIILSLVSVLLWFLRR